MKSKLASSGLVYSTDSGRTCPDCLQAVAQCVCKSAKPRPATDGVVRISRSAKGRGGKTVTLIQGLPLDDAALMQLGKQLKAACGSGGTVKDGVIEVQGDHRELLQRLLLDKGYSVKLSGG
ncbi:MAG: translation initiation factor Sui1 [Polaromonas sp.]